MLWNITRPSIMALADCSQRAHWMGRSILLRHLIQTVHSGLILSAPGSHPSLTAPCSWLATAVSLPIMAGYCRMAAKIQLFKPIQYYFCHLISTRRWQGGAEP